MAIITLDELYIKIHSINDRMIKNGDTTAINTLTTLALRRYNPALWNSKNGDELTLAEFYFCYSEIFIDAQEKLSFFLMIYRFKKKMFSFNTLIVASIIKACSYTRVDPELYLIYWEMFLSNSIYRLINNLEPFIITQILCELIKYASLERLQKGDYRDVEKLLCEMNDEAYSPIFKNDFNGLNIYATLYDMINKRNSKLNNEHNFRILELITNSEMIGDEKLKACIRDIEEKYYDDETRVCLESLKTIRDIWAKKKGISLIILPKGLKSAKTAK